MCLSPLAHTLMANLLQSGAPHIHILSQSATILLVWSAKGNGSALTSKASSRVNLVNDDTYLLTIIVSSFRQIKQSAYHIYSTRKAFLEHAVVELVYKFDEKSTASV